MRISICGNIGCGKSTLLKNLESHGYKVHYEPINDMKEMLDLFYVDMSRWAFTLQMQVLALYRQIWNHTDTNDIHIIERSPFESRHVFASALIKDKQMNQAETKLYNVAYEQLSWQPDILFYLRADPEVCMQRIKKRSRNCELSVSLDYIKSLHEEYENIHNAFGGRVFAIDASKSETEILNNVIKILG